MIYYYDLIGVKMINELLMGLRVNLLWLYYSDFILDFMFFSGCNKLKVRYLFKYICGLIFILNWSFLFLGVYSLFKSIIIDFKEDMMRREDVSL